MAWTLITLCLTVAATAITLRLILAACFCIYDAHMKRRRKKQLTLHDSDVTLSSFSVIAPHTPYVVHYMAKDQGAHTITTQLEHHPKTEEQPALSDDEVSLPDMEPHATVEAPTARPAQVRKSTREKQATQEGSEV